MAWIQSQQELARNPKTKRAARALDISLVQLVGHLHILWHWCLDFAPDGDLAEFDVEEIAEAAMWENEPQPFICTLLQNGFLEETEAPGYMVADWFEIGGKIVEQRRVDAERKRNSRAQKSASDTSGTSAKRPADVRRMSTRREEESREEESREEESREEESREEESREEESRESAANRNAPPDRNSSTSSATPEVEISNSEEVALAMCEVCGLDWQTLSPHHFGLMEKTRVVLRKSIAVEMSRGDPSPQSLKTWLADEIRRRFSSDVWQKPSPPYLGQIGSEWERQRMALERQSKTAATTNQGETTRDILRKRIAGNGK